MGYLLKTKVPPYKEFLRFLRKKHNFRMKTGRRTFNQLIKVISVSTITNQNHVPLLGCCEINSAALVIMLHHLSLIMRKHFINRN